MQYAPLQLFWIWNLLLGHFYKKPKMDEGGDSAFGYPLSTSLLHGRGKVSDGQSFCPLI
jgi:hypothetical protein